MTEQKPAARRYRSLPALKQEVPVDFEHARRLAELRRQVQDGTYVPDPERIAAEILEQGLDSLT
ncbi:MAG: flagellar biosynthesis anti-sigma factor FlgM [Dehalococcoidia bacterium]|nr:flagellar biosynthesis anti-sigma factor FlgM [Dehalococcoidia bacterium]MCB9485865.1 flagellar biosynthesis anti-sigma factor FlgM [Thermoflexaceae bacterium]